MEGYILKCQEALHSWGCVTKLLRKKGEQNDVKKGFQGENVGFVLDDCKGVGVGGIRVPSTIRTDFN